MLAGDVVSKRPGCVNENGNAFEDDGEIRPLGEIGVVDGDPTNLVDAEGLFM